MYVIFGAISLGPLTQSLEIRGTALVGSEMRWFCSISQSSRLKTIRYHSLTQALEAQRGQGMPAGPGAVIILGLALGATLQKDLFKLFRSDLPTSALGGGDKGKVFEVFRRWPDSGTEGQGEAGR